MRIISSVFYIFLLLSFFSSNLDAKKRGNWGDSKRTSKKVSSFKQTHKISKFRGRTSFDQARDLKAKKSRAKKSFRQYQESKNSENSLVSQQISSSNIPRNESQNMRYSNLPEIDIEMANSRPPAQTYFKTRKSNIPKYSPAINGIYIIIAFILIIGMLLWFFSKQKSKRPIYELPLDIRLGGIIDLESIATRLLLNRDNLQMVTPKTLKGYITSIGTIKLDDDLSIYNVYASENIDDEKSIFTLKIELLKGVISVVKIFTHYETIYPSTVSEWEKWLDGDENNYPNIGGLEFKTPSEVEYERIWERGIEETVRTKFIESISTENTNIETLNIVSLYGRELETKEIEFLYVSNIEDADLNNFIKIELGLAVKESELVII